MRQVWQLGQESLKEKLLRKNYLFRLPFAYLSNYLFPGLLFVLSCRSSVL